MSGITPLLAAFGAYGAGRRQKQQDDLAKQQQEQQASLYRAETEGQTLQNKQTQRNILQDVAEQAYRKKLKLPPDWVSMPNEQKVNYLTQTYRDAQGAGATDVMTETLALMNAIPKGTEEFAHAGSLMPWQQKVKMTADQLKTQLEERKITANATIRSAMIRASAAGARAGANPDERILIAEMTALNMANRQDEAHAQQAAIDQWKADKASFNQQAQNAQIFGGPPPQPVAPLSVYLQQGQPSGPVIFYGPGANGQIQQQQVQRGGADTSGGGMSLSDYVNDARKRGVHLGPLLNDMKAKGATPKDLQDAAYIYQDPFHQ